MTPTYGCAVEIVLVDDGSGDGSPELLGAWAAEDPRVRVVELSRNFGHQAAITAGVDFARGDAVVVMDRDLQDPPEVVREMLAEYRRGYDVVYGTRRSRGGEGAFKRGTASVFYWVMRRYVYRQLPRNTGDFRLMSAAVLDALRAMREGNRFMRGMVAWVGFPQTKVLFDRPARTLGETKYPLTKMIAFALDAVLAFSSRPLRFAAHLGLLTFLGGVGLSLWLVGRYLLHGVATPGWTSLAVLQCVLSGLILLSIGVMGEYVGRLYDEQKDRPLYIVRWYHGLAPPGIDELRPPSVGRRGVAPDPTRWPAPRPLPKDTA